MTPQSIKLNNKEEATACVEALKAFGFSAHESPIHIEYEKKAKTLWFNGENLFWFVSNRHKRAKDQKEFANWKDFAAEILKEYSCKVSNDEEKLWLIDALDIKGCSQPLFTEGFPYFYYTGYSFSFRRKEPRYKTLKTITQIKTLLEPMKKEPLVLKINNAAEAEEYSNVLKGLGISFDKFLPYQSTWESSPRNFLMMRDNCFFTRSLPYSHYLCKNFDEFLNKLPQKYKKNMKTEKKHKIEITTQEAAYLCAILNNKDNRENALKQQGCDFMLKFEEEKHVEVWDKFNDILEEEEGTFARDCQHLFEPQIKEFGFSNGLETKSEGSDLVSVGCQTKSKESWLTDVNNIIALDLQEVKKEGYTFTRADVEGFRLWLMSE